MGGLVLVLAGWKASPKSDLGKPLTQQKPVLSIRRRGGCRAGDKEDITTTAETAHLVIGAAMKAQIPEYPKQIQELLNAQTRQNR